MCEERVGALNALDHEHTDRILKPVPLYSVPCCKFTRHLISKACYKLCTVVYFLIKIKVLFVYMSAIALNYNRNDNYIILYELIFLFNTDKSRADQNRLKFAICSSNCINSCDIVSKSSDLGVRSVYLDSKVEEIVIINP